MTSTSPAAAAFAASPLTAGNVYVMIHGLFFMEQSGNNLKIYAPIVANHLFRGGVRNNLQILQGAIDWTTIGLMGNSIPDSRNDVVKQILQFSRSATDVGDLTGPNRGTILLPWPEKFIPLRLGPLSDFKHQPGVVGAEIVKTCGTANQQIGLVTALRYSFAFPTVPLPGFVPTRVYHFFNSPDQDHDIFAVNADIKSAASIFSNPKFDLQLDPGANFPTTPLDSSAALPPGVGLEDELSTSEKFGLVTGGVSSFVNSTVQRLRALEMNINAGGPNLNPANCPNLFVHQ